MDKNVLIGIIVVLLLTIIIVFKNKENNTVGVPQQEWNQWDQKPSSPELGTPEEIKPDIHLDPNSYKEAFEIAKKRNCPVFLFFETNHCSWCKKMKDETFSNAKVRDKLSNFVVYICNADEDRNLSRKYNISGVPAYFILSKTEQVIKRDAGFKNVEQFSRWIDNSIHREEREEDQISPHSRGYR